jgi:Arc/MetJ-type ribon-helix-helix transcriptional regulator
MRFLKQKPFKNLMDKALSTLSCDEEITSEIHIIRAALIEGEMSGEPAPFDSEAFKQKMRSLKDSKN